MAETKESRNKLQQAWKELESERAVTKVSATKKLTGELASVRKIEEKAKVTKVSATSTVSLVYRIPIT